MKPTTPKGYPKAWTQHPPLLANPVWVAASAEERHLHLAASCILGHAQPLPYTYVERQLWYDWTRAGFVVADFICVVQWRKARNAEAKRTVYSLRLSTMLESLTNFADDLHQARKGAPRQPAVPCEELIQILPGGGERRVEIATETPEPVRVDAEAALAELRQARAAAGLTRKPVGEPVSHVNLVNPIP